VSAMLNRYENHPLSFNLAEIWPTMTVKAIVQLHRALVSSLHWVYWPQKPRVLQRQ
jgi:hypothetical protein